MTDAAATTPKDTLRELPDGSLIQYGPFNDRIYLMRLHPRASSSLAAELIALAHQEGVSKIFAKVPEPQAGAFVRQGFVEEARIPAFYYGQDAAIFFAYYLDPARAVEPDPDALDAILNLALDKDANPIPPRLDAAYRVRPCTPGDADAMAEIYRIVFASYPFPIHDPAYLIETMNSHVDYFGIETGGRLIALSSAEQDTEAATVEMTDFATHPDWLGNGFGRHLLARMEQEMKAKNIKTAHTIARAASPGMNITFGRAGYTFGGRLKNNTNISGRIESMNVWHKPLL